jgi:DNA-binding transcriptional LysR family regulator
LNLQQLRYLCAIADHGLNVSEAAAALFTSQPGVSKQVRQLEDELGVRVFVRAGKRIASITPAGEAVIATARRALREIDNVRRGGIGIPQRERRHARDRDDAHAGAVRPASRSFAISPRAFRR